MTSFPRNLSLDDDRFIEYFVNKALKCHKKHIENTFSLENFAKCLWEIFNQDIIKRVQFDVEEFEESASMGDFGRFNPKNWNVKIDTERIQDKNPIDEKALIREIVATIYHEAYHVEQYYRVARLIVVDGIKKLESESVIKKRIETDISVSSYIIEKAYTHPTTGQDESAERWYTILRQDINSFGADQSYKSMITALRNQLPQSPAGYSDEVFNNLAAFNSFFPYILNNAYANFGQSEATKKMKRRLHYLDSSLSNIAEYWFASGQEDRDDEFADRLARLIRRVRKYLHLIYRDFPHEEDARLLEEKVVKEFLKRL